PRTQPPCPRRVRTSRPAGTSQTRTVRSALPDARRLLSGANATLVTQNVCPVRVRTSLPLAASQTRTSPGRDGATTERAPVPAARYLPSGLKATLLAHCVRSVNRSSSLPVSASQTFTSPPARRPPPTGVPLAVATRRPSGLKATPLTR